MLKRYNIQLTADECKLPLLFLTQRGQGVYLVPSRCHEKRLPDNFSSDFNMMRNIRSEMITDPKKRLERI